jgi:hypothetical protein
LLKVSQQLKPFTGWGGPTPRPPPNLEEQGKPDETKVGKNSTRVCEREIFREARHALYLKREAGKSMILLKYSQTSPIHPSHESSIKMKTSEWLEVVDKHRGSVLTVQKTH